MSKWKKKLSLIYYHKNNNLITVKKGEKKHLFQIWRISTQECTFLHVITQEDKEAPFNSVVWFKTSLSSQQWKGSRQLSPKKEPPLS